MCGVSERERVAQRRTPLFEISLLTRQLSIFLARVPFQSTSVRAAGLSCRSIFSRRPRSAAPQAGGGARALLYSADPSTSPLAPASAPSNAPPVYLEFAELQWPCITLCPTALILAAGESRLRLVVTIRRECAFCASRSRRGLVHSFFPSSSPTYYILAHALNCCCNIAAGHVEILAEIAHRRGCCGTFALDRANLSFPRSDVSTPLQAACESDSKPRHILRQRQRCRLSTPMTVIPCWLSLHASC